MYSDVKLQREGNTRTGPKTLILSFFFFLDPVDRSGCPLAAGSDVSNGSSKSENSAQGGGGEKKILKKNSLGPIHPWTRM